MLTEPQIRDSISEILRPHDFYKIFILSSHCQVEGTVEFMRMAGMSENKSKSKFMESFHEPYKLIKFKPVQE